MVLGANTYGFRNIIEYNNSELKTKKKEGPVFDWILVIQSKTGPSDYLRISGYGSST